jgi:hypothetical protein
MFLDFGTHACTYCRQLDAITFRSPMVAKLLNDNFIPVRVDAERERDLTNSMGVRNFPTLVILDGSGRTLGRREGFCEPDAMAAFLEQGRRVIASATPRQQVRGQAMEDRIPARVLAIEEPVRRPQQPAPVEVVNSRPETLHLPSPEELGLASEKPAADGGHADWTALHARLEQMGATCLQVQRPSSQLVRIVSMFPMAENRVHRIEASGATEAEAVRLFLEQVDEWAGHP